MNDYLVGALHGVVILFLIYGVYYLLRRHPKFHEREPNGVFIRACIITMPVYVVGYLTFDLLT